LRQDELEHVLAGRDEPALVVEVARGQVARLDDDLERLRLARDRVPLGVVEQLPAQSFVLVLGADEELLDAHRRTLLLERDVAGGRALDLGDEHRLVLEDGQRPLVRAAVELGQPEENRLVVGSERADLGFPEGHLEPPQYAIARSTASCSSGERATDGRPRSSSLT
jgi:hypothetical protein